MKLSDELNQLLGSQQFTSATELKRTFNNPRSVIFKLRNSGTEIIQTQRNGENWYSLASALPVMPPASSK